jgi:hypothetical protein
VGDRIGHLEAAVLIGLNISVLTDRGTQDRGTPYLCAVQRC